jgi:hypothetical protein
MYREWKEIELCWFGDVQRMEGNRIPKRVLYKNLEKKTRVRERTRNRWQDEVRGGLKNSWWRRVAGKVYTRKECKKLLRMARNRHILHIPMELIN